MRRGIYLVGFVFSGLFWSSACTSYSNYCDELINCEGGNDADVEACEIQFAAAEDYSDDRGCNEWFGPAFDCVEEKSSCTTDASGRKRYGVEAGECDDELADISACGSLGVSSSGGDNTP